MKTQKSLFLLAFFFLLSLSFLPQIFAACINTPTSISVSSGTLTFDNIDPNSRLFVKKDLNQNPLQFKFQYVNTEDNCFLQNTDMTMKLFPFGATSVADTINKEQNNGSFISTFVFNFQVAQNITNPFTSTFNGKTTDGQTIVGSLSLATENNPPEFLIFQVQPSSLQVGKGQEIRIDFAISDTESLLSQVSITGSSINTTSFQKGKNLFEGSIVETLQSSQSFFIRARDRLGLESSRQIDFIVDGTAPILRDIKGEVFQNSNEKFVKITAKLEDLSFEQTGAQASLKANFTNLQSGVSLRDASCFKIETTVFQCEFSPVKIGLSQSQVVNINFEGKDKFGNTVKTTHPFDLLVDTSPAQIEEFVLVNSNGLQNLISPDDKGAFIRLVFKDESVGISQEPQIVEKFGRLPFVTRDCSSSGTTITCIWQLGASVQVYATNAIDEIYSIQIKDAFSNSIQKTLNISVDNQKPEINSVEVLETESIKDGIIKSGEKINVQVFFKDNNFFPEGKAIGNFSRVDFRSGMGAKEGTCVQIDPETIRCDFNGIIVENGHFIRNVDFQVIDSSGNKGETSFPIEVFSISNEVVSSFRVPEIDITNPINRKVLLENSADAWFEGSIQSLDETMTIINYQLVQCNESELDPLLLIRFGLFPEEIVLNTGEEDVDDFIVKVEMKDHNNILDLNDKSMTCTLSILKRDDEQVFPPELVDVTLNFEFYDIPRSNLIKAQAQSILDDIESTEYLGGYFTDIYDIYTIFSNVCGLVSGGVGVFSSASNVITGVQYALAGYPPTKAAAAEAGLVAYGTEEKLSFMKHFEVVQKVCAYVTCENGGLIGSIANGALEGPLIDNEVFRSLFEAQQSVNEAICTGNIINDGVNAIKTDQTVENQGGANS